MKIEIDLSLLQDIGLRPDDYIYLYSIYRKAYSYASNKKARNKYKKIVSNKPHLHSHVMHCLKMQLSHEGDNLGYLQNFETWINNHTWEKYEDMNIKDINDDRRITRQL